MQSTSGICDGVDECRRTVRRVSAAGLAGWAPKLLSIPPDDRRGRLEPNAVAARSDPEAERGQGVSRDRVLEHGAKALHRGASDPRPGHDEIIVLILCRNKAQPVLSGDRLDRDTPIGSVLRDGDTNRIVRLWLRPVASRRCSS